MAVVTNDTSNTSDGSAGRKKTSSTTDGPTDMKGEHGKSTAAAVEKKERQRLLGPSDPLVAAMIKGASDKEILDMISSNENHHLLCANNALALHLAIERDYLLDVIEKLVTPVVAMKQPNAYGYPPLHNAIMNDREYYVVLFLLEQNRDAAAEQLHDCGSLPVHAAVRNQYSLEVIQALVAAFPNGVIAMDRFGCTPLHTAVMYYLEDVKIGVSVIQFLLTQSADTAAIKNAKNGDFPLHAALRLKRANGDYYLALIKLLVDAFPIALEIPDANGCIPLHITLLDKAADNVDVIKYLLKKNSKTASLGFDNEDIPLHFALSNHSPFDVIRLLVDAFPEGLLVSNSKDEFPLFIPLKRKDDRMVAYFLSKLPGSSATKSRNNLPIHLAIELCLSTEVICSLLAAFPNSLCVTSNGKLPRDLISVGTEPLTIIALEKSIGFWAFYAHRFRVKGEPLDDVVSNAVSNLVGAQGLPLRS